MYHILFSFLLLTGLNACSSAGDQLTDRIICGAECTEEYLPLIEGKNTALVVNQTSKIGSMHLLDTLLRLETNIIRIFSPEHGIRGDVEAGAFIGDEMDRKTGLTVFSLYGKNKEITVDQLRDVDVVLFDLQDVGTRFYTYISTMHYVMKACASARKKLIILDRPNPNGNYVDGPVLRPEFSSFVGMHPIPVVHGLTVGELALMINGEGWLGNGLKCELEIIKCRNYTHASQYVLPVPPSPNLPNYQAVRLYPSLTFFEGTKISVGRGTDFPFQVFGHPALDFGDFYFTPVSKPGYSIHPPYEGQRCRGLDLRNYKPSDNCWKRINLEWVIRSYNSFEPKDAFFTSYFDKLAGTDQLRKDIIRGLSEKEIRQKWNEELKDYRKLREKYLLYPL